MIILLWIKPTTVGGGVGDIAAQLGQVSTFAPAARTATYAPAARTATYAPATKVGAFNA